MSITGGENMPIAGGETRSITLPSPLSLRPRRADCEPSVVGAFAVEPPSSTTRRGGASEHGARGSAAPAAPSVGSAAAGSDSDGAALRGDDSACESAPLRGDSA